VGLRHPEVFSCIAARSCNFSRHNAEDWYPREAAKRLRIYVYYGDNDPVPIRAQSRTAIAYLRSRGFRVRDKVIPNMGHQRRPAEAIDFFRENLRAPRPSIGSSN